MQKTRVHSVWMCTLLSQLFMQLLGRSGHLWLHEKLFKKLAS